MPTLAAGELRPGLHRIDSRYGARLLSLYLLVGPRQTVLFDTGVPGTIADAVLPYLAEAGLDAGQVTLVVVSHADADHFGGIVEARAAFPRALVVAHELDAPMIADRREYDAGRARPFRDPYGLDPDPDGLRLASRAVPEGPVDVRLRGEAVVDLGDRVVELLHVPGHSAGHLALRDSASGALVVADAVLGDAIPNADGSPAFAPTYRYVADYRATIARLSADEPELLLTTHYPTYDRDAGQAFLRTSAGFADTLEAAVLARAGASACTLAELADELGPVVGRWPAEGTAGAMAPPVAGHLEDLLGRGLLRRTDDPGPARFRAVGQEEQTCA